MSTYTDLQAQVASARAKRDTSAANLAVVQQAQKRVAQDLLAARRVGDREAMATLTKQQQALAEQVSAHGRAVSAARGAVNELLGGLAAFADPTKQIAEWSDRTPILLFPLRLETRFHGNELWIRIYPDDCQIDGFEPMLRESELASVTAFWIATWRAGGVEGDERGAWKALVGGIGSGRAAYAIGQFTPTNPADRPVKASPDDVVLILVPTIAATPAEESAMRAYWLAVWAADGEATREADARAALVTSVGAARADALVAGFAADRNGWDPPVPKRRADVTATCAVLRLPPAPQTTSGSWNQPTIAALPDRFVALLYTGMGAPRTVVGRPTRDGLSVAPDPSLPAGQQIGVTDDDLKLDENLLWIADFHKAVEVGMGIVVPLTDAESRAGFDRLLVVGLRASSDSQVAKHELETLISHQLASKAGYGLVPQGSPTNNTESGGTPHSWVDDADAAYDIVFKHVDAYPETPDPLARRDGEWLASALGIDDAILKQVPHAAGMDQAEARAMNIALWNGTLGYGLEQMLTPMVARADIAATRLFFTRYVSGRGPLPAVRVGNQPYGVLPALAFSRYRHGNPIGIERNPDYLQRLHTLLARMDADWRAMAGGVAHVGKAGDAHQILLDIVGLHSGSVEYHQRYAESLDQLFNKLVMEHGSLVGGILAGWMANRGQQILTALGADPNAKPPILGKFFYGKSPLLSGPVVDDVPLSEDKPIRAYTADNRNYLAWLATASLEQIRRQDFGGKPEPTALLYLMLRHSMMLGQWDAGLRFLETHKLIDPVVLRAEPAFLHVQEPTAAGAGESKFQRLIAPQPAVTGSPTMPLADYVLSPGVLFSAPENEDLAEIVRALQRLTTTPTARLERVFAEHIDCVTYRLDAWKTGLAAARLDEIRATANDPAGGPAPQGIYLGAFGWLEELRPRTQPDVPVRLEGDLAKVFQRPNDAPLTRDPQNAGYVHAPSLNQAAAAAILKNAYRVNASPANPDAMAVNLSSNRVRQALSILEGIRNGQTLGALLGYRFERGLHDEHTLAEVDKFIYPLRQAFPLAANQLKTTRTDGTVDIKLLEARNVIDGQKLIDHIKQGGQATYPFGLSATLPAATAAEATAINTEVDRLLDLVDALGDLTLAESVYQVVLGNFDRASAVTTALQHGSPPPDMQVVKTPRSGIALQHRVALHLDPSVDPSVSPSTVPMTPRARADASLNAWLASRMPAPADVGVQVTYASPASPAATITVTQAQLGLQPIDLLYLGDLELEQQMAELDDRIVQFIRYSVATHPALDVKILYTEPASAVSLFELAALIRSLRALVLGSRTLAPSDMSLPLEATADEAATLDADDLQGRLAAAVAALTVVRDGLNTLVADGSPLDAYAQKVSAALLATAAYGIPQTGTGQIHDDLRGIYEALAAKVRTIVDAWKSRSTQYTADMAAYAGLSNPDDRMALLKRCELLVSAGLSASPPSDPDVYQGILDGFHANLNTDISTLEALLAWSGTDLAAYAAAVGAAATTVAVHDVVALDIADQLAAMSSLRETLVARVTALAADVSQRLSDAATTLASLPGMSSLADRIVAIQGAAKRVLGDESKLVPRFTLAASRAAEFTQGMAGSAALLTDLVAAGRRFPVDDWLYGVARVRPKLAAWENAAVLGEAFSMAGNATLTPLQFPYVADDRWTALEFDTKTATRNDRLVYTAHFAAPFVAAQPQCGLVLDDWPEVVPADDVVSGVTFQFDRPSSAPPQAMILALPAALTGHWTWDDLVATLVETLDAAKTRAVEPAQIDDSSYAQMLPSTVMAVTLYWITIATNLAMNNKIYDLIGDK